MTTTYTVLETKLLRPKAEIVKKRSFKQFKQQAFLEDLSKVPFSTAYIFDDPDDVYWLWEKLYTQVLDDLAPVRSFKERITPQSKFITAETRAAMRERDRLKRKYNKSRHPNDWEKYRVMRNKVVSKRRQAVHGHFRRLCTEKTCRPKEFLEFNKALHKFTKEHKRYEGPHYNKGQWESH